MFAPSNPVNNGGGDFENVNCALCTAGALTGKKSGEVSSVFVKGPPDQSETIMAKLGMVVLKDAKSPYPYPKKKDDWDDNQFENQKMVVDHLNGIHQQIGGMKFFCLKFRGGTVDQKGTADQLVPGVEGRQWMGCKPDGTEFAVYFCSQSAATQGHWIYAINRGSSVEFIDYQQSKTPNSPIPTSQPSCLGQKASGSDTTMLILAFSPG